MKKNLGKEIYLLIYIVPIKEIDNHNKQVSKVAPFQDTIFLVNEMNMNHHMDKKLQFDFLINSLRKRKRYTPWLKAKKIKNLEYVKEYYGYGNEKAKSALDILNDEQIKTIIDSMNKGGKHG